MIRLAQHKRKVCVCCKPTPASVIAEGRASPVFEQTCETSVCPSSYGAGLLQWVSFHSQQPGAFLWVDQPWRVPFSKILLVFRTEVFLQAGTDWISLKVLPKIFSPWFLPPVISQAQCGSWAQETALLSGCQKALDTAQEWGADETKGSSSESAPERQAGGNNEKCTRIFTCVEKRMDLTPEAGPLYFSNVTSI